MRYLSDYYTAKSDKMMGIVMILVRTLYYMLYVAGILSICSVLSPIILRRRGGVAKNQHRMLQKINTDTAFLG